MKKYLKLVGIVILGTLIGIGGTLYWVNDYSEVFREMQAMLAVAEEMEEAEYLYQNAKPEIEMLDNSKMSKIIKQFGRIEKKNNCKKPNMLLNAQPQDPF